MMPVRFSYLKAMAKSPAHARHAMTEDSVSTPTQQRGTAVHAIVLGNQRVTVAPEGIKKPTSAQRNAKKAKPETLEQIAAWDEWERSNEGAIVLSVAKYNEAQRMAESVRDNPHAMDVLTGRVEQTILFDTNGRACRATPDVVGTDWLADLKTSITSSPDQFPWQSRKYCYHCAMAWYQHAAKAQHVYLVAVESAAPYPVTVFKMSERALEIGSHFWRLQMERLIACEQSGQWPAYAQSIVPLELPGEDELDLVYADEPTATDLAPE